MTFTIGPDAPPGPFSEVVTLKTNDPAAPSLPIHVEGNILPALKVAGKTTLKLSELCDSLPCKIIVHGCRPFKILRVDGLFDGVKVDYAESQAASHILTLTCQPCRLRTPQPLVIHTDLDQKTVTLTIEP